MFARTALAMLLLAGLSGTAAAQPWRGPPEPDAKLHERMRQARGQMLRRHVGLDEATAKQAEALLDKLDPRRRDVHQRKREAAMKLRQLMKADSSDQAAYEALLAEMEKIHDELHSLRKDQFRALKGVLTPKQQARLLGALHRMGRHMMRGGPAWGGRRGHGGPPPGGGWGLPPGPPDVPGGFGPPPGPPDLPDGPPGAGGIEPPDFDDLDI